MGPRHMAEGRLGPQNSQYGRHGHARIIIIGSLYAVHRSVLGPAH